VFYHFSFKAKHVANPPIEGVAPPGSVAVMVKELLPQGAGEFPMAITNPIGWPSPPRKIGPLDPAFPKVIVICVSPVTVMTMVETNSFSGADAVDNIWDPGAVKLMVELRESFHHFG
jgi:hypothetical protein